MKPYLSRLFIAFWFGGMVALAVWNAPVQGQAIQQKYLPLALQHAPLVVNPPLHTYVGLLEYGKNDNADIYTVRADGTDLTQLTNDGFADSQPQWSFDSSHIAFRHAAQSVTANTPATYVAMVMNRDGSDLRLLVPSSYGNVVKIVWSPVKNEALVFTYDGTQSSSGYATMLYASVDTGDVRVVGHNILWSNAGAGPSGNYTGWSPDGRAYFYAQRIDDFHVDLWIESAAGGTPVRLAQNSAVYHAQWHPTSQSLLVEAYEESTHGYVTRLIQMDGTVSEPLFSQPYRFFGWIAGGNELLVRHEDIPFYDLYRISIQGGSLTPVTETSIGNILLSPRRDYVVYETDEGMEQGPSLYVVSLADNQRTRIEGDACVRDGDNYFYLVAASWSDDGSRLLFTTYHAEDRVGTTLTCRIDLTQRPLLSVNLPDAFGQIDYLPHSSQRGMITGTPGYPPPEYLTPWAVEIEPNPSITPLFPGDYVVSYEWRYLP